MQCPDGVRDHVGYGDAGFRGSPFRESVPGDRKKTLP